MLPFKVMLEAQCLVGQTSESKAPLRISMEKPFSGVHSGQVTLTQMPLQLFLQGTLAGFVLPIWESRRMERRILAWQIFPMIAFT